MQPGLMKYGASALLVLATIVASTQLSASQQLQNTGQFAVRNQPLANPGPSLQHQLKNQGMQNSGAVVNSQRQNQALQSQTFQNTMRSESRNYQAMRQPGRTEQIRQTLNRQTGRDLSNFQIQSWMSDKAQHDAVATRLMQGRDCMPNCGVR
jgi:hypothetical protein